MPGAPKDLVLFTERVPNAAPRVLFKPTLERSYVGITRDSNAHQIQLLRPRLPKQAKLCQTANICLFPKIVDRPDAPERLNEFGASAPQYQFVAPML
jgi:hypothetical protein